MDAQAKYTYGALKGNFNPISDTWDFNYEPNTQGGFFDYELFCNNITSGERVNQRSAGQEQQFFARVLCFVSLGGRVRIP